MTRWVVVFGVKCVHTHFTVNNNSPTQLFCICHSYNTTTASPDQSSPRTSSLLWVEYYSCHVTVSFNNLNTFFRFNSIQSKAQVMTAIVPNNFVDLLVCRFCSISQLERLAQVTHKIQNKTNSPSAFGRQIGRMKSVIGTRSLRRSSAMSLSKLVKLKSWTNARRTKRVSGRVVSLHRSCSPNVTRIINQRNLKRIEIE